MLISPAEPAIFKSLGQVSSVPETLGSDFLIFSPVFGLVGIQRKEINDLVASLGDRIPREIIDMSGLDVGIWLIEGMPQFTGDGQLMSTRTPFTLTQYQGVIFSLCSRGFWMLSSTCVSETMSLLLSLGKWLQKPSHNSLLHRTKERGVFGQPSIAETQIFLLQSLPGIGYELAKRIVAQYQGLPVQLRSGVDLTDVDGIGPKTARRIREIFE